MTTAVFEKRLQALEEEVEVLKKAVKKQSFYSLVKTSVRNAKKLPAGLRQALREVEQGKLSGPFATVSELKDHLERR